MSAAPVAALARVEPGRQRPVVGNRVLLVLLVVALAAALGLAFLRLAPNRLVTGTAVPLSDLLTGGRWWLACPAVVLALAVLLPQRHVTHAAVALAAALLLAGLVWLAGDEAARQSALPSSLARVSLGGSFWALVVLAWLAAADALQRLHLAPAWHTLAHAGVVLPVLALLGLGALDPLSLLKEYANRHDVFDAAALRHLQIVLATLAPSLLIGVPLGVVAARKERLAAPLFAVLNVIQTVPSIALFALLIAPLGWLAQVLPGWGIGGIGLLPAVIALTLYSLLPIVHGTASGLRQVPADVIEAATAMGLTRRRLFWHIEVPLALPVWLSGLRITTVQVIGLTVVAALIGAGGFGAIVFQGLLSSALDLVLLGVLPVVALALAADTGFKLLTAALEQRQRPRQR